MVGQLNLLHTMLHTHFTWTSLKPIIEKIHELMVSLTTFSRLVYPATRSGNPCFSSCAGRWWRVQNDVWDPRDTGCTRTLTSQGLIEHWAWSAMPEGIHRGKKSPRHHFPCTRTMNKVKVSAKEMCELWIHKPHRAWVLTDLVDPYTRQSRRTKRRRRRRRKKRKLMQQRPTRVPVSQTHHQMTLPPFSYNRLSGPMLTKSQYDFW